ncbi:MAG: hypothetical protein PWP23_2313 [Candidatus Sumerlaeota bacterium]|nr:hypothetical protein [Candidatus Sumerlaeota bacterium]
MRTVAHNGMGLRVALGAGAVLWLVLAFASAWKKSIVIDEAPHIGCGLAILAHGDYRMNPEHPPLMKVLAALPVYLFDRPDMRVQWTGEDGLGYAVSHWVEPRQTEWGHYLIFRTEGGGQGRLRLARVMPILIGLLGGVFAFLWGREWSGTPWGGAAAAMLLLFYPEYLGHARYVTLDVPTLVACGAISWAAWCWWRRPDGRRGAAFVLACAVGSQVKLPVATFAAVTVFVLFALSFISGGRVRWWKPVVLGVATLAAGVLAAWAGAGFRFAAVPAGAEVRTPIPYIWQEKPEQHGLEVLIGFAHRHRLLPEATLATFSHVQSFEARETYFMGRMQKTGSLAYFFVTILLKTPLVWLAGWGALLATGALFAARGRRRATAGWRFQRGVILLVPFLVLFGLTVLSRVNLGHRHILALYFPLQVVLGAQAVRWLRKPAAVPFAKDGRRLGAAAVLAMAPLVALLAFPHYATYFNAILRTPYGASPYLGDSNIDWGQDLILVREELERRGITEYNLAVFAGCEPAVYGLETSKWLLPGYPFVLGGLQAVPLDRGLPTVVSMYALKDAVYYYPEYFSRDPDVLLNSMAIYLPEAGD